MHTWPTAGISFGGDYNPEQWPEAVQDEDIALMNEAGVTVVSLGIFSWALLEPRPAEFDFGWLDRVMDRLHEGGIRVDLATATASAPPWLSRLHPEVLPVDRSGNRLWPGSRQTYCPSSPVFAELSLRLVDRIARRYADHPALAMWHVSNELGCHNVHCFCDVSANAFRHWLQRRYADLDGLNDAWGTSFWSQHYGDWQEVLPPRMTTAQGNPTQELDFWRFSSDESLAIFTRERDLLNVITPGVPVTTNLMAMTQTRGMDYWSWAPQMDIVSNDHYIVGSLDRPTVELSWSADVTRNLAARSRGGPGSPWFLMEHSTSAVNWQPVNLAKAPGQLVRNSLTHLARGADGIAFFQWRASLAGAEKFHSALLPHAGTDTKVWREVVELGELLGRLDELRGTSVTAQAALVFDWQSQWATGLTGHPSTLVDYDGEGQRWYAAFWDAGITVDVVPPDADLTSYDVVVVPMLYSCTDAQAANIAAAAQAGAEVVVTYFSGIVDEHEHVRPGGYPGAFRELLGLAVEEFFPLPAGEAVHLDDGSTGSVWSELVHLRGAKTLAAHTDGPVPGSPAVTRHEVGDGAAWYVATSLEPASLRRLVGDVVDAAGVSPIARVPAGVEVVRRQGDGRSFLFVLNHTADDVEVAADGFDLRHNRPVDGSALVKSGDALVIREMA
ncbi:MAG: beta-galactosidase [Actinomycetales bacterium]